MDIHLIASTHEECIQRIHRQERLFENVWDAAKCAPDGALGGVARDALRRLRDAWDEDERCIQAYFDMATHERSVEGASLPAHFECRWDEYYRMGLMLRGRLLELRRLCHSF